MNKHILNCLALGAMAFFAAACGESESDLLEPKVYFESKEYSLQVEDDQNEMLFNLSSRLSSKMNAAVEVSYTLGDKSIVDAYNAKYGSNYQTFDAASVELINSTSTIGAGKIYSDAVQLKFMNLDALQAGKPYLLPVKVTSNTPTEEGTDIAYFIVNKPLKLKKAGDFAGQGYIDVAFPVGTYFKSFTFEGLIYVTRFTGNSTIMGSEGVMIFRIGDIGGSLPKDMLQIAGQQNYYTKEKLTLNRWYHVAVTYDQPSGKTAIYVNGEKWAESAWSIPGFDPFGDDYGFKIGRIVGFQWGDRPFYGSMCELRVWSVARTQNQLKQNMFGVDPQSEGLMMYYKLDGSEAVRGGKILDSTGKLNSPTFGISIKELPKHIEIN